MEVAFDDAYRRREKESANKTIGRWGSLMLLVNNATGPGLIVLPLAYQSFGWLNLLLLICLYAAMSVYSSFFLAECMSRIPGNDRFQGNVEYMELVRSYLSPRMHKLILSLFCACLMGTIVGNIISSAQVMDQAMLEMGSACGLELSPHARFFCIGENGSDKNTDSIFGNVWVISAGYCILMLLTIPFGLLNIGDNISVQMIAFFALLVISVVWIVYFLVIGVDQSRLPAMGGTMKGFGFILFNFSWVLSVPAWINEKHGSVNLRAATVNSAILTVLLMTIPSILAALALDFSQGQDLLIKLTEKDVPIVIQLFTYFFPISALVTSIPVLCIVLRFNLERANVCSNRMASFISVWFPWIISWALYGGNLINYLLTWVGIITITPLNFIVPAYIYLSITGYRYHPNTNHLVMTDRRDLNEEKEGLLEENRVESSEEQEDCNQISESEKSYGNNLVHNRRGSAVEETVGALKEEDLKKMRFEALQGWQRGRALLFPWAIIIISSAGTLYALVSTAMGEGKSVYA